MYPLFIVIFFSSIIGFANIDKFNSEPNLDNARANALATNELFYASAVKQYVTANPGTTGTVAQASLNLPAWFNNLGWTNEVTAAGVITVYPTSLTILGKNTEISSQLITQSSGSQLVGLNRSGQFFNPISGINASITIPVAVPNNAPVYILTTK